MPYQTFWYVENKVAYLELIGEFSMEEMVESSEKLRDEFLDKAEYPVHLICDLRGLKGHPRNIKPIRDASNIYLKHPSMGWVLFLGMENPIVNFLVTVVSQVMKTKFKTISTLNEAHEILQRIDLELTQETFSDSKEVPA